MVEPHNHTLHLLQDIRRAIEALDNRVEQLDSKVDRNHAEFKGRFDSLQKAMVGESVLGRYATAEFEERMDALEGRVAALERR